jgi:hypothetical protein
MKLKISEELKIDTEDVRVKNQGLRIAIIGESGSGKSWAISIIAEQAIQQGLQVIFVDPHGEYWTFAEKFDVVIIGGEKGDLIINEECIEIYGEIVKQGKNVDFNLRELMDDEIAYGRIVEKILRILWKVLVNNPRPCLIVFEEAQMICPQEKSFDVMRRVGLVKSVVTGGRKFGLSFILGSQRPAELHKTPLSQCWIRLFGKTTERLDRNAVEDYLKPLKSDVLKNLSTGQFYAYGWFDEPLLVNVTSRRITRHGGDTPLITPIKRTEMQQASIEEFKRKIDEVLRKKTVEESELERLAKENKALEKRLAEADSKVFEVSRRLEELKDIRDMIAPLAEKVQSGKEIDSSVLGAFEDLKSRIQALELGRATGADVNAFFDSQTGLVLGDARTQILFNKLLPDQRKVFLALENGPCNIVTLARKTNLSENRLRTILCDLRRKNLVKVLNQKEKRSSNLIGAGKFYRVIA